MLNIYTGREDIDKQRWLFARVRAADLAASHKRRSLLVVPDQFTLETERGAFSYLNVSAFVNPVVLSMNRLAEKVLAETGEQTAYIDRYGKYMLLARLLYRGKSTLELYQGLSNSVAFIERLSDAIMSLKAHLISPEALFACAQAAGADEEGGLLGKKLHDVAWIYAAYEAALTDGLPDSTDILRRFGEKASGSALLKDASVWIWGFDYFSPLHLAAIGQMAVCAEDVNVVLTAEAGDAFFSLTNGMAEALAEAGRQAGVGARRISVAADAAERAVDCSYLTADKRPSEIVHLEQMLFRSGPARAYGASRVDAEPGAVEENPPSAVRFVASRSHHSEAEAAAQTVWHLIREEGLRFRDILILCNDQERRAKTIQRVFGEYGIETFIDKRHDAGYNPVLTYITALPEIISRGRRAEDVLHWIGTGLTDISDADAEELENYCERYGLRGGAWSHPLTRGANAYDEETFARISAAARYVGTQLDCFAEAFGAGRGEQASGKTAHARTEGFRTFLTEEARLPGRLELYADALETDGFLEYAAHMRGIWEVSLEILAQIEAALGELPCSADEYATILRVGFSSVLMGVLPASSDAVTIGTMQRTRTGHVKAVLVLGANDGELPMFAEQGGLLDDTELETLEQRYKLTAFRREENLHDEEQLAIYKNLSKPTRLLYVSYTFFGADGKSETKPSRIFERLRALFPEVPLEKAAELCTLPHPQGIVKNRSDARECRLDAALMKELLPVVFSPTALEKYSRCPFSFLMERGLRLGELRKYELDDRGMGEVYHETLRRFGEKMCEAGAPSADSSLWNVASRRDTDALVEGIFQEIVTRAGKGTGEITTLSEEGTLFFDEENPVAVYRRHRLKAIVKDVCWVLTERARDSGIEQMFFETDFGRGGELETVRVGDLKIAGRIDRLDILPGGLAKLLDYKSGAESWNKANIENGWQLQLMLYLKAAETRYEPIGASYFRVFEPRINLSDSKARMTPEEIKDAVLAEYQGDGAVLCDPLPEHQAAGGHEKALTRMEWDALRKAADDRLLEISAGLANGAVPARPGRKAGAGQLTACTYCTYRSICNFEA